MIGPIKWLRYYRTLIRRSVGLTVALGCMKVQLEHWKNRMEYESDENQRTISANVAAMEYWLTRFERVQNCTFLSDEEYRRLTGR